MDGSSPRQGSSTLTEAAHDDHFVLSTYLKMAVPGLLLIVTLMWFIWVLPVVREVQFERVQVGMTLQEVRGVLGPPRSESRPWPEYDGLVWHYGQGRVMFGDNGRVISKSGDFSFD